MSDYKKINIEANEILKTEYFIRKIFKCEVELQGCWHDLQSWHHKHKRNWYKSHPELLSEYSQTLGVCNFCHDTLEKDPKLTVYFFKKFRGNEMNLSKKKPVKAIKKSSKKAEWMKSHKCRCGNTLSGLLCPKCGNLSC